MSFVLKCAIGVD